MVLPGTGFFGDPYLAFNGMHYPYNIGIRSNPYAASLYGKSKAVMNMTAVNDDRAAGESSGPRKRIAMACGRCRKRKIRCSGDKGDGQPCTNCANSNHSPCQFLRVNSCETHYRNDFNYTLDAARHTQVQPSIATLPSQVDEENPVNYIQGHFGFRNDAPRYENSIRIWQADGGQPTSNLEYNLSPNPSQEAYLVPYRTQQSQQPRTQEPSVYLSNASFGEGPEYQFNGGGQVSTLAFRPAPVVNVGGPSGPGSFPILNTMAGDMTQDGSSGRNSQTTVPSQERRPLPSSSTAYRATTRSPSYERASQQSPQSHPSPASMTEASMVYGQFSSSSASASVDSTIPNIGEIKLDPERASEAAPQGASRNQSVPELHYRYPDTTQYRLPASGDVSDILHCATTLSTQASVEAIRSVLSPTYHRDNVKSPSGSHR